MIGSQRNTEETRSRKRREEEIRQQMAGFRGKGEEECTRKKRQTERKLIEGWPNDPRMKKTKEYRSGQ
jgi:hypothetical protein